MEYYPEQFEEPEEVGLVRLSRVTYHLAEGQPDAMGWGVADIEGVEFGTVSDLLADLGTGQIVFVAVTANDTGRTALVPVEGMYLDELNQRLIIPARQSDIKGCPDFTDDAVDISPYVEYWLGVAAR